MDEDLERCSKCKNAQLTTNFYVDITKKDRLRNQCIKCTKQYLSNNKEKRKLCERKRRADDVKYRLINNTRLRIHRALKEKIKSTFTIVILGIDNKTYKSWIKFQMTPEMNWSNIEMDHVKPICTFDVSKHEELREAFSWKNTQPLLKHDHHIKGTIFNFLDYQLQFIKAYQFTNLIEEGLN